MVQVPNNNKLDSLLHFADIFDICAVQKQDGVHVRRFFPLEEREKLPLCLKKISKQPNLLPKQKQRSKKRKINNMHTFRFVFKIFSTILSWYCLCTQQGPKGL